MKKNVILLFIAALFLVSCGLKAPPLPPEAVVPERISDLKVKKTEGGITLKWTIPTTRTDPQPRTGPVKKLLGCGGAVVFSDTSLSPYITYTYVVISYDSTGNFSKTSNSVVVSLTRVK